MSANKIVKDPLWATLLGALVAAMVVSFCVVVQSGEAKQAADRKIYEPQIVGGTEVPNGKYPFMTFIDMGTPKGYYSWCGATLIDRDSVLTAAHCFYYPNTDNNLLEGKFWVRAFVGRTVRSDNQGQMRFAKWVSIHPAYNNVSRNPSYDVAVIQLRRPVLGIQPIKLATSKQDYLEKPGRKVTVAGWGNTIASSPFDPPPPGGPENPDRMHEAQVPIVSDSSAKQAYDPPRETRVTRTFIYPSAFAIAAGGNGGNGEVCHGDSGGPLFVALGPDGSGDNGDAGDHGDDGDDGGSSGKYTQIGIAAFFTGGCAYKDFPTGYTEVNNPSIRGFIKSAASE